MNASKRAVFLALIAGISFWAWQASRSTPPASSQSGPTAGTGETGRTPSPAVLPPSAITPPAGEEQPPRPEVATAPAAPPPSAASAAAPSQPPQALHSVPRVSPAEEPFYKVAQDVGHLRFMLRDFRLALGGNPVGSNAEIIRALLGRNPKNLKLELGAGRQLNAAGELVDPWGSPYFFHQVSAQEMEIRCAGPDRTMWNKDDVVVQ